jgi:hypothetical protein
VFSLLTVGPLPVVTRTGVRSLMDLLAMVIFAGVMASFAVMTLLEARRLGALERSPAIPQPTGAAIPNAIGMALLEKTRL